MAPLSRFKTPTSVCPKTLPHPLQLKAEREAAAEAARLEEAFRQLLLEQDVRLLAAGSWVSVRSRVADDPRFRGVDMDRRRKEVYLEVVEAIKDHAAVQAALNAAETQRELTDAMLRGVERSPRANRVSWTAHNNNNAPGDATAVEVCRCFITCVCAAVTATKPSCTVLGTDCAEPLAAGRAAREATSAES